MNLEEYYSLHTNDNYGFCWDVRCDICDTQLAGYRFEVIGLKKNPNGPGMISEEIGYCCEDCLDEIEG